MRKLIYTLLILILTTRVSMAQNSFNNTLIIPEKPFISLLTPVNKTATSVITFDFFNQDEPVPLFRLLTANQPLLTLNKAVKSPIQVSTEISFNDLLENTIARINRKLLNTYDDNVEELFKEAPSMLKMTCTINF